MKQQRILNTLIIDDSPDDVFTLERAIKKLDFQVHLRRVDNQETLTQALQNGTTWDIVFCDVRMPQLSVHKAIQVLDKYSCRPISIIIVSGIVKIDEMSRFIRGGVRDFIPKDDFSNLGDVIQREMGWIEAKREQASEHNRFIEAQKMEAVGILAGGIAHDFNNILTALIGMQWQIRETYADHDPLMVHIDHMDQLCHRASHLVKQLLGFARKETCDIKPLALCSFISENIALLRISIPETIHFIWEPLDHEIYIQADVTQLQQMLLNLINNARDAVATTLNPTIRIHIDEKPSRVPTSNFEMNQWVAIEVLDNGIGLTEETRKHLFEPFYTTKEVGKGTGLGLAMVYGSMLSHHGFVDCISGDAQTSTCIRLLFSQETEPPEHALEINPTIQKNSQHHVRILFADDEKMIQEIFCGILEVSGAHVDAFDDGLVAWQHFQQHPHDYDIIVLDISMPNMTGPEVARNIRKISSIPILLISGYDMNETLKLVSDVENITIQSKPFHPDEIINIIQKLTGDIS